MKTTLNDHTVCLLQKNPIKSVKLLIILLLLLGLYIHDIHAQERPDYLTERTALFTLEINGLNNIEGEVRIAMFNSQETYKIEPLFSAVLQVQSTRIVWSLEELPFGDYAIAVYHDKNMNGKLDTNFLGIPKERYGFSNNARGRFGPASWNESYFTFNAQNKKHVINIR